ncbi:Aminopeptidase YpdF (MP-, MA-, MS-, AP-, NP- specific) [Acidisarcina polymorpha]|uniref:Aminopeptidase YpdF (MP-, MA-, MS-, AP-, NP-specific) n=1 Tax=Acidisarcina polymorpha TaxID=2211140 RepID=A0A2Z5G7S1_9BACT|nr:aminopeptidase P family protein [Acidisarcina polymorpha]AXC14857.1 Aminopeptidase YpdF (MP-, MA-, MS-, AP-, NP- specific) [Acidisarcina polymorpha]
MNYSRRFRALRRGMKNQGIEALLITHLPDVRYLCGFTGSNAALAVSSTLAVLFTDGRYSVQAKQQTQSARVVISAASALRDACVWLSKCGAKFAYFSPEHVTVAALQTMRESIDRRRRNFFTPLDAPLVVNLRLVKDEEELAAISKAAALGCELFAELLDKIEAGTTEIAVAAELEFAARTRGAEAMSFETIVASGPRSALPHGHATLNRLPVNGFVTLDFGVILNGYCSDMTRTVHIGKINRRERFAYEAVLEAQQAAVEAVSPGATCGEVDEAARGLLRKAGLDQYFTHSTGHGVGIEIHEAPRIAKEQEAVLVPGMVITIEPGVYVPGKFGIRIEDMVTVTDCAQRVLTPAPKTLIEL